MTRPVYEDDVIKAIKFKLNNEESAWKKQNSVDLKQEQSNKNDENSV